MQTTIAFASCDNVEVLKDSKGMNKKDQAEKIMKLYMPSIPEDKARSCYVDQFLSSLNQFKGLFECNTKDDS